MSVPKGHNNSKLSSKQVTAKTQESTTTRVTCGLVNWCAQGVRQVLHREASLARACRHIPLVLSCEDYGVPKPTLPALAALSEARRLSSASKTRGGCGLNRIQESKEHCTFRSGN